MESGKRDELKARRGRPRLPKWSDSRSGCSCEGLEKGSRYSPSVSTLLDDQQHTTSSIRPPTSAPVAVRASVSPGADSLTQAPRFCYDTKPDREKENHIACFVTSYPLLLMRTALKRRWFRARDLSRCILSPCRVRVCLRREAETSSACFVVVMMSDWFGLRRGKSHLRPPLRECKDWKPGAHRGGKREGKSTWKNDVEN